MAENDKSLHWKRAQNCESSSCVEVAGTVGDVYIRNSRDPDGTVLTFTRQEWEEFVVGVRGGQFQLD